MAIHQTSDDNINYCPHHKDEVNIQVGSLLREHHQVTDMLGEVGFGLVSKCINLETGETEAIKINKSHPDIVHQATEEIVILKKLQCLDADSCNIVKWNGLFFHNDNICLNFELLDQTLYGYIAEKKVFADLRLIIHQLTTALLPPVFCWYCSCGP